MHGKSDDAPPHPRAGLALIALLCGAVCIALSPIFVRVSETGPTATAFWRVALAVPALWLMYAAFGVCGPAGIVGSICTFKDVAKAVH